MEYLLTKLAKHFYKTKYEQNAEEIISYESKEIEQTINDFQNNPFAIFISMIVDENQIDGKPEKLPYEIKKIYGSLDFETLEQIKLDDWRMILVNNDLTSNPDNHAKFLFDFINIIKNEYNSDIKKIWEDSPSSKTLKQRLLNIPGFNETKSNMLAYILASQFNIVMNNYNDIDITDDMNIKLAMEEIGLVDKNSTYDQRKEVCRKLNPEFPAIFDSFFWMISEHIINSKNISDENLVDLNKLITICKNAASEFRNSK